MAPIVETDDGAYAEMPAIVGESLATILADVVAEGEPLNLHVALTIAMAIADELYGRHGGIVHGDLVPQHVLVGYDGRVALIDPAGDAAKERAADPNRAGYRSPEHVEGTAPTYASDVFVLGVLLFEMTTGRRLYGEPTHEDNDPQIVDGHMARPRDLVGDGYPIELQLVLRKLLRPSTSGRFTDARAAKDALRLVATARRGVDAESLGAWMTERYADRRQVWDELLEPSTDQIATMRVSSRASTALSDPPKLLDDEGPFDSIPAEVTTPTKRPPRVPSDELQSPLERDTFQEFDHPTLPPAKDPLDDDLEATFRGPRRNRKPQGLRAHPPGLIPDLPTEIAARRVGPDPSSEPTALDEISASDLVAADLEALRIRAVPHLDFLADLEDEGPHRAALAFEAEDAPKEDPSVDFRIDAHPTLPPTDDRAARPPEATPSDPDAWRSTEDVRPGAAPEGADVGAATPPDESATGSEEVGADAPVEPADAAAEPSFDELEAWRSPADAVAPPRAVSDWDAALLAESAHTDAGPSPTQATLSADLELELGGEDDGGDDEAPDLTSDLWDLMNGADDDGPNDTIDESSAADVLTPDELALMQRAAEIMPSPPSLPPELQGPGFGADAAGEAQEPPSRRAPARDTTLPLGLPASGRPAADPASRDAPRGGTPDARAPTAPRPEGAPGGSAEAPRPEGAPGGSAGAPRREGAHSGSAEAPRAAGAHSGSAEAPGASARRAADDPLGLEAARAEDRTPRLPPNAITAAAGRSAARASGVSPSVPKSGPRALRSGGPESGVQPLLPPRGEDRPNQRGIATQVVRDRITDSSGAAIPSGDFTTEAEVPTQVVRDRVEANALTRRPGFAPSGPTAAPQAASPTFVDPLMQEDSLNGGDLVIPLSDDELERSERKRRFTIGVLVMAPAAALAIGFVAYEQLFSPTPAAVAIPSQIEPPPPVDEPLAAPAVGASQDRSAATARIRASDAQGEAANFGRDAAAGRRAAAAPTGDERGASGDRADADAPLDEGGPLPGRGDPDRLAPARADGTSPEGSRRDRTTGGTTPEGTTRDGTTPNGTTRGGNTPGGTTPGGTTPGGTTPGGTTPGGTTPGGTTPDGNTPGRTSPDGTSRGGTTPDGTTRGGNTRGGTTLERTKPDGASTKGTNPEVTDSNGSDSNASDSNGSESNGPGSKGPGPNAPDSKGTDSNAPGSKGTDSKGTDSNGPGSKGTDSNGPTPDGAKPDGTKPDGTKPTSPDQADPAKPGPAPEGAPPPAGADEGRPRDAAPAKKATTVRVRMLPETAQFKLGATRYNNGAVLTVGDEPLVLEAFAPGYQTQEHVIEPGASGDVLLMLVKEP